MTTTNNKSHIKRLNTIVLGMIKKGYLCEARMFGKFIENRNKSTLSLISKKFNRIFNEDELNEIVEVIYTITNKYIPASIRGSEALEAEFMRSAYYNIHPLFTYNRV